MDFRQSSLSLTGSANEVRVTILPVQSAQIWLQFVLVLGCFVTILRLKGQPVVLVAAAIIWFWWLLRIGHKLFVAETIVLADGELCLRQRILFDFWVRKFSWGDIRTCFVSEQSLIAARGRKWIKRQIAFEHKGRLVRTSRNLEIEDAVLVVEALLKVQKLTKD